MIKVTMLIDGMMCGMCEAHVKDALRKRFPEGKKFTASHSLGEASFLMDQAMPKNMIEHDIKAEFKELGYKLLSLELNEVEEKKGFLGLFKR